MRSSLLIILLLPILCFCQSGKQAETNSLQDLKIGKSQSGVRARIIDLQETNNNWQLTLSVEKSQQGGASSPVIPVGAEVTGMISELTIRKLDQLRSSSLTSDMSTNRTCFAVLGAKNKQTGIHEIYDLIIIVN